MNSTYSHDQETNAQWVRLRRHGLAVLTLILLIGMAYFEVYPPRNSFELTFQAACWRMAPLTGLIWLAYYHILALPTWLVLIVPASLAIAVFRPRALLFFLPLFILILILRPRKKGGQNRRQPRR
jgi:hypothetical protein